MSQGGLWFWPFVSAILTSIWGLGFAAILGFHFDPLIIVIPFLPSSSTKCLKLSADFLMSNPALVPAEV